MIQIKKVTDTTNYSIVMEYNQLIITHSQAEAMAILPMFIWINAYFFVNMNYFFIVNFLKVVSFLFNGKIFIVMYHIFK